MTLEEAFQVVAAQERLPLEEIDVDLLMEAREVIMRHSVSGGLGRLASGAPSEADRFAQRVNSLLDRVMDRQTRIREQRAATAKAQGGSPQALFTQMREQGAVMGDRDVAVTGTGEVRLSPEFESRLREAAAGAGVDEATVDGIIASTRQLVEQTGMNPEFLLQQQLDQWEREAERNAPTPIGVPKGFIATPETELHPADRARFGGAATATQEIEPRYFEGDHLAPASMAPEEIIEIQKRLERAGLLVPGQYWEGFWDAASAEAYYTVLGYSNQRGTDWGETLQALIDTVPDDIRNAQRRAVADVYREPAFIKPDFATLSQEVKAMFRARVGRDPTDAELSEWAANLSESYRAQHEALVSVERAEFNAGRVREGSIPEGTDPADRKFFPDSMQPSVGSTQVEGVAVDPLARFAEAFESRYGAEIDRLESLPQVRQNMANVQAAMTSMGRLVGG